MLPSEKMKTPSETGFRVHEEEQRRAWLELTPAQRLAWLEEAKRFAEQARRARKAREEKPPSEEP